MRRNFPLYKLVIFMDSWPLEIGMASPASGVFKLPYRYLGSSGLKVSTICLGTMTFGQREVGNWVTGTIPAQNGLKVFWRNGSL